MVNKLGVAILIFISFLSSSYGVQPPDLQDVSKHNSPLPPKNTNTHAPLTPSPTFTSRQPPSNMDSPPAPPSMTQKHMRITWPNGIYGMPDITTEESESPPQADTPTSNVPENENTDIAQEPAENTDTAQEPAP
ncbi:uncharacterized protein LOC143551552 [Bidens hawaiensis]|uniref:uncharacterized protein LOC143551552 n=1 Tax=Bidens hawaiensis TaxID=980011 RepID=UPI00404B1FD9